MLPHFQSFENVQFVSSVKFVVKSEGKFFSSASVDVQLPGANFFWLDGQKPKGQTLGLRHEWEIIHTSLLMKPLSAAGRDPCWGGTMLQAVGGKHGDHFWAAGSHTNTALLPNKQHNKTPLASHHETWSYSPYLAPELSTLKEDQGMKATIIHV